MARLTIPPSLPRAVTQRGEPIEDGPGRADWADPPNGSNAKLRSASGAPEGSRASAPDLVVPDRVCAL